MHFDRVPNNYNGEKVLHNFRWAILAFSPSKISLSCTSEDTEGVFIAAEAIPLAQLILS